MAETTGASRLSFDLKPLNKEAIPHALERAQHYRLLNEPSAAESICRDVLAADPDNQRALITMLLAITDQFGRNPDRTPREAREVAARLTGAYEQVYYVGIIAERQGKATARQGTPGCGFDAYEWLTDAMGAYEKAEELSPPGDDDAILRWNACARLIMRHDLKPRPDDEGPGFLE